MKEELLQKCKELKDDGDYSGKYLKSFSVTPSYQKILNKAGAADWQVTEESLGRLENCIDEWTRIIEKKKEQQRYLYYIYAILDRHNMEAAVSKAYFVRADKLSRDDRLIEALGEIFKLKKFRINNYGIRMREVKEYERDVRSSIKRACEKDIGRLLGVKSWHTPKDLELKYKKLRRVMTYLFLQLPVSALKDWSLLSNLVERAYTIRKVILEDELKRLREEKETAGNIATMKRVRKFPKELNIKHELRHLSDKPSTPRSQKRARLFA